MTARLKSFKEEHPLGEQLRGYASQCGSLANIDGLRLTVCVRPCELCGCLSSVFHYAEKRQAEAARIRDKYPDRIPVRYPERFVTQWLGASLHFYSS